MLKISEQEMREGAQRARDVFMLQRLRSPAEAEKGFDALWERFGLDPEQRDELIEHLVDLLPVTGVPEIEGPATWGLLAGVLVGLLIADSATPVDGFDDLPLAA